MPSTHPFRMPLICYFQWCSRGSRGVTALYHWFLDKITVNTTAFSRQLQFCQYDKKAKCNTAHKVLLLPHCKFYDYVAGYFTVETRQIRNSTQITDSVASSTSWSVTIVTNVNTPPKVKDHCRQLALDLSRVQGSWDRQRVLQHVITQRPQRTHCGLLVSIGQPVHRKFIDWWRVFWRLGVEALLPSTDTSTAGRQTFDVSTATKHSHVNNNQCHSVTGAIFELQKDFVVSVQSWKY